MYGLLLLASILALVSSSCRTESPSSCDVGNFCGPAEEFDALGDRLERVRFPEDGTLLEEFNELGYDECKRLAALIEDAVDDECLEYYEGGIWLKDISFARGESVDAKPPGFSCYE
jgi:hypothetical protein